MDIPTACEMEAPQEGGHLADTHSGNELLMVAAVTLTLDKQTEHTSH